MNKLSTIASGQFQPEVGNPTANYKQIADIVSHLEPNTLAVFPELCVTGYDMESVRRLAASIPGPLINPLLEISRSSGVSLVVGIPERKGDTIYNSQVFISGGEIHSIYRKHHLWGPETEIFDKGEYPVTAKTNHATIGFMICHDLSFPEFTLEFNGECDLLINSAAWEEEFINDWKLLLRARAFDSGCYVVGSNLTGNQGSREYGGTSLISNPNGECIVAAENEPDIVKTEI